MSQYTQHARQSQPPRDHATRTDRLAPHTPLAAALRYLRTQSRRGYCLDTRVQRLPAQDRTLSVLDAWRAGRGSR